jgi:RNA polymerase sigma-70 factor (ECF subfamily)
MRARDGDSTAVATLYRQHQSGVYRYMVYRLNDHHAAEDLTSEVFVRMIRSLGNYRFTGIPFEVWLYRIAHNMAVDYYRRNGRYKQVEFDEDIAAVDADPAAATEHRLNVSQLHAALRELNDTQREVIILRFIVRLPIAQTAQVLHKSENAIKGLQRRALHNLRQSLSEMEAYYV